MLRLSLFFFLSLLFLPALAYAGELRVWTNRDGRQLEAELVTATGLDVVLLKDGKELTIPLARLCEADRKFVAELLRQKRGDSHLPEPPVEKETPIPEPTPEPVREVDPPVIPIDLPPATPVQLTPAEPVAMETSPLAFTPPAPAPQTAPLAAIPPTAPLIAQPEPAFGDPLEMINSPERRSATSTAAHEAEPLDASQGLRIILRIAAGLAPLIGWIVARFLRGS